MSKSLTELAAQLGQLLTSQGKFLVTAESCTGGGVAYVLTEIAGSSSWFDRGFITYTNEAKVDVLDVPVTTIEKHGAVSQQTAEAMAVGALLHSRAHISIAVTGIAGPSGGSAEKPVGTVWFSWGYYDPANKLKVLSRLVNLDGDRHTIRLRSIEIAVEGCFGLL